MSNITKRFFSLFLALIASVGIIYSQVIIDGIAYNLNANSLTAEVTSGGFYNGEVVIPSSVSYSTQNYSVTSIGDRAFMGCNELTSVTIPNSVSYIGVQAFLGCSGLTIPVGNAHCFAYLPQFCTGTYRIPEGIQQIAGGAFWNCSNLTSIIIPNSVTNIGDGAFALCGGLNSITCYAVKLPTLGENVFIGVNYTKIPLYVPQESIPLYSDADQWKDFDSILPISATYTQTVLTTVTPSNNSVVNEKTNKFFLDGALYILRDDKTYTITGQEICK